MSGALPQPPMAHPVLQGATAGMAPAAPQGNPMQAKLQTVLAGAREIIQTIAKTPGSDQAKLQQATQLLQQGVKLLAESVHKPQAGP